MSTEYQNMGYELTDGKLICPVCQAKLEPIGNYESVKCECGAKLNRLTAALVVEYEK